MAEPNVCLCGRGPVWHRDMCGRCLAEEGRALDDLDEFAGADVRPQHWHLAVCALRPPAVRTAPQLKELKKEG